VQRTVERQFPRTALVGLALGSVSHSERSVAKRPGARVEGVPALCLWPRSVLPGDVLRSWQADRWRCVAFAGVALHGVAFDGVAARLVACKLRLSPKAALAPRLQGLRRAARARKFARIAERRLAYLPVGRGRQVP